MDIQTSTGRFAEADVQALAVAVFKDEKADEGLLKELDAATGGIIRSVIEAEELKGKEGETVYIHLGGNSNGDGSVKAKRLLLVGVGERESYKLAQISQMAGIAARALRARSVKSIGLITRAPEDAA
ncbi:MAG: M17 family peptidase N-terminal domain-containing protein, partial [Pyrinomonadaceae bacterium]